MQGLLGAVEAGQEEVERQAALSLQLAKDREGERRLLSVRSELAERMDTGLLLVDGKVTAVEAALDEETSSRAASNMMSMVKTTGLIEEAEARRVSGDKSLQVLSPPSPSLSLPLPLSLSPSLPPPPSLCLPVSTDTKSHSRRHWTASRTVWRR